MAITLNDNIRINAGKPSESRYLNLANAPYTGTSQVISQISAPLRYIGLTVNVNNVEYWFQTGVTNGSLVVKSTTGGTSNITANNGLTKSGSNIHLGGTLTGNTTIAGGGNEFILNGLSASCTEADYTRIGWAGVETTGRSIDMALGDIDDQNSGYTWMRMCGHPARQVWNVSQNSNNNLHGGSIQFRTCENTLSEFTVNVENIQNCANSGLDSARLSLCGRNARLWTFSGNSNNYTDIKISNTGATVNSGLAGFQGLKYGGNYRANFVDLSLVDKKYVDLATTGNSVTANNGLTKSGNNIHLGGSLTGDTTVSMTGTQNLFFCSPNNDGGQFTFHLESSGGTKFSDNYFRLDEVNLQLVDNDNNKTANIALAVSPTLAQLNISSSDQLTIGSDGVFTVYGPSGMTYCADYSLNYSDRSIPDVAWVLEQISGATSGSSSVGASNGLSFQSGNVVLGGELTGNTYINTNGYGFSMGGYYNGGNTVTNDSFGFGCHVEAHLGSIATGYDTCACGQFSSAFGYGSQALGARAHAEGRCTVACGYNSHAEGECTVACGNHSHAEGQNTCAIGQYSHTEGYGTRACANGSHAEGQLTMAIGGISHAEGRQTVACGNYSHAEGCCTIAYGHSSHAEGENTKTYTCASHAEGCCTIACGYGAHSEGCGTFACGNGAHAEGCNTIATGPASHAEGKYTCACAGYSHTGGYGYDNSKRILACGVSSFNHSSNNQYSIVGQGANAHFSAILGGVNHHIDAYSTHAAIIGGKNIKLTGSTYSGTTAVGQLAIMVSPTIGTSGMSYLVRDSATGIIKAVTGATGGGSSNVLARNGLSKQGDYIVLGGTLTGNTNIQITGGTCLTFCATDREPFSNMIYIHASDATGITNNMYIGNNFVEVAIQNTGNTSYSCFNLSSTETDGCAKICASDVVQICTPYDNGCLTLFSNCINITSFTGMCITNNMSGCMVISNSGDEGVKVWANSGGGLELINWGSTGDVCLINNASGNVCIIGNSSSPVDIRSNGGPVNIQGNADICFQAFGGSSCIRAFGGVADICGTNGFAICGNGDSSVSSSARVDILSNSYLNMHSDGTADLSASQLNIYSGGNIVVSGFSVTVENGGNTGFTGIQYGADFSLFYTDRSLVDKAYVDAVASGLDPKGSVRVATVAALTGATYHATGGTVGTGSFTSAPSVVNGITVTTGDRILVKNQVDAKQNGIYFVFAANTWYRAADQDGTPSAELSSGNFTFVETGNTLASTGWVVTGDGILTPNVDNINWVQFSAAGLYTAGDGIDITGNVISLDPTVAGTGLAYNSGVLSLAPPVMTIITGATTLLNTTDIALVNTSVSSYTVSLPASPTDGKKVYFKDISQNANVNNITISGNGNTIDGSANAALATNGGSVGMVYNATLDGWFIIAFVN